MKIKTSGLTGPALDWTVASIETHAWAIYNHAVYNDLSLPARPSEYLADYEYGPEFSPSADWSQGGPIIEREKINVKPSIQGNYWLALDGDPARPYPTVSFSGATPLIAAMRCFVASKWGDEVEIPEELTC